jgi:hypothetical protein
MNKTKKHVAREYRAAIASPGLCSEDLLRQLLVWAAAAGGIHLTCKKMFAKFKYQNILVLFFGRVRGSCVAGH